MWSGGDDYNEKGGAVRLYQPILYGRKASQDDLTCSFIGGCKPSSESSACASCKEPLQLLVQLFDPKSPSGRPLDRALQVFACNRADCINSLFSDGKLANGSGVIICRRFMVTSDSGANQAPKIEPELPPSSWVDETAGDNNEWAVEESDDGAIDALEAKLAAMETAKPSIPSKTTSFATSSVKKDETTPNIKSFPCYLLHSLQEPAAIRSAGMDEDDVGISGTDDKIQKMLARYMAEEEDVDLLAALRDSSGGGTGFGGGSEGRGEKDERLSAADRALLTYLDRLKRSPRQVLRYAYGGAPLWSM
jgi:pre-rRNA-processing protein TSR4